MLFEGDVDESGCRSGYTPEYVRVAVSETAKLAPGTVVDVTLGGFQGGRVQGTLASG